MFDNSQVRHLFYNFIKNLVQERQSGKFVVESKIATFIATFYSFRGAFILFTMMNNYQTDYWQYEYLLCFARTKPKLYDSLLTTAVIVIGIFLQKAKKGFLTSPLKIWNYFYELVVRNTDYYKQCKRTKEEVLLLRQKRQKQLTNKLADQYWWFSVVPVRVQTVLCSVKARFSIWKNLDDVNLSRMQRHSIRIYSNEAPLELRIKLVLAVNIIDKICFVIQIFICKFIYVCHCTAITEQLCVLPRLPPSRFLPDLWSGVPRGRPRVVPHARHCPRPDWPLLRLSNAHSLCLPLLRLLPHR